MCGILGFINNDKDFGKGFPVFQQMLLDGLKRGVDGTGVMLMDKAGALRVQKSAMWSPDFICGQAYQKDIAPFLSDAKFAVGHNRASTKGAVKRENSHPFTVDHITLVHNGYIQNSWSLLPHGINHDVDSFSAAYVLAKKGEKEGLESLRGAFALVWYNAEDNTINMARNEQRPLWLMYLANKDRPLDTMLFMSEWENLYSIMARNDLRSGSKFRELPIQQHIKFKLENLREFQRIPFVEPPSYNSSYTTNRGHYGYPTRTAGSSNNSRQDADKEEPQSGGSEKSGSTTNGNSGNNKSSVASNTDDLEPSKREYELLESLLSSISKRQRRAGGIPTSKKAIRHAYQRLKKKGYRLGQSILLYCDSWAPYEGARNNLGVIRASKRADVAVRVEVHNVSSSEFEELKDRTGVYGTVVNYKETAAGTVLICVLDSLLTAPISDNNVECCSSVEECCASGECLAERRERESAYANAPRKADYNLNGPGGSRIDLAKFIALTSEGCINCTRTIDPNTHTQMHWVGTDPLCADCVSVPQIAVMFGLMHPSMISKEKH